MRTALDRLYGSFNSPGAAADPIQVVRRWQARDDREVVGLCAAVLAFGRVSSVLQSIERVVAAMEGEPAAYVRQFDPSRDGKAFSRLVHRWIRGPDIAALLWIVRQMFDRAGSIEGFFLEGYDRGAEDVGAALDSFSRRALALDLKSRDGRRGSHPGVRYFFPRPTAGSGCKRLNLYLRWMVRRDRLDLGLWRQVSPAQLVVPLDTHVVRVGRCLGLTQYTSPGWPMALDITASLKRLDPEDPVKYDFALCHVGMMNACGFNRAPAQGAAPDARCPLRGLCRPRARRQPQSRRSSGRR